MDENRMHHLRTRISRILHLPGSGEKGNVDPIPFGRVAGAGLEMAFKAPFYLLLIMAVGDFERLRSFAQSATSAEMNGVVLSVMALGFAIEAVTEIFVQRSVGPLYGAAAAQMTSDPNTAWFSQQGPAGANLAMREVTTARAVPNADAR